MKKNYSLFRVWFVFLFAAAHCGFCADLKKENTRVRLLNEEAPQILIISKTRPNKNLYPFSDANYTLKEYPTELEGLYMFELPSKRAHEYECLSSGVLYAVVPQSIGAKEAKALSMAAFEKMPNAKPAKLVLGGKEEVYELYKKNAAAGDKFLIEGKMFLAGVAADFKNNLHDRVLYNGIKLPEVWPPRRPWSNEPMPVPYLKEKPAVININVGRQLFVDDFLIADGDFEREYHYPQKYENNPVLKAETPLEINAGKGLPGATVKSGGIWWNPEKRIFEMWYEAGWVNTITYAYSVDGLTWERPNLGIYGQNNQIVDDKVRADSGGVVVDYSAPTDARVKLFLRGGEGRERARVFVGDGVNMKKYTRCGLCGDRSTMFYNPFRKKWVFSLRWNSPYGRSRAYIEADDFINGADWLPDEPVFWANADILDKPDPAIGDKPQLYNLDAVAYESIMLGFFEIHQGPDNNKCAEKGLPKITGLNFAYSRDGFHWQRPDRTIAVKSEQQDVWDRGYVQSLANICTVRGDKLWFYFIGYAGDTKMAMPRKADGSVNSMKSGMYSNGATGVAFLRRDGFVSINSKADKPASLTTELLSSDGKFLFVNLDAPKGAVYAEILDEKGNVIKPFTFENCEGASGDSTIAQISWKGVKDLSALLGKPVRLRFKIENGKLYAFWISPDSGGQSRGFVAGGGPGYTSSIDTVGKTALDAETEFVKNAPERKASAPQK